MTIDKQTKRRYNYKSKPVMALDKVDYALASGRETTPESGSAMLALAIMAQAKKEHDIAFLLDQTVNFHYFKWLGIKNLGYLFKEAQCSE